MTKLRSFSQKVLDRRRERRLRRAGVILRLGLIAIFTAAICVDIHYTHKRTADLHQATLMINAPTWADFQRFSATGSYQVAGQIFDGGMPDSVYINGQTWRFVEIKRFNDWPDPPVGEGIFYAAAAKTYCGHNTIAFIKHIDQREFRNTIMHEIFHAAACEHGGDAWWNSGNRTPDHPGIYHLADFTSSFMKENPTFVLWMIE